MFKIPELSAVEVAFPADVCKWLPAHKDIPEYDKKFENIAAKWFYGGLPKETDFIPKEGVDARKALMAIKACLGSFQPKHEHKMAAAGYLLSEWFSDIKDWDKETPRERELKEKMRP